ncbi:hypothetical protein N1851_002085 [Merluccius polli]|uniref:Uncharacterized protein n=1 Tax=Merluccius polli TaxID=89951 RepID=A0AA47MZY4_MERPO|nr:hypothetical protein N1851_010269 [Merluccius polli]KAK0155495.1 hypothetical protein N1851_002085 [Merluccius polli]
MRNIGCPEVTVNTLKNKSSDDCFPAKKLKKPKNANPSHPAGETDESLENVRLELLNDIRQRNSAPHVREKMSRTFSSRRKEVVQGNPAAREFKARWPALFHIDEVSICLPFPQGASSQYTILMFLMFDVRDNIMRDLRKSTMGIYVIKRRAENLDNLMTLAFMLKK